MRYLEYEEAKQAIINGYTKIGFNLTEDDQAGLGFQGEHDTFQVLTDDITTYADFIEKNNKYPYHCKPNQCGIINNEYREQLIESIDPRGIPLRILLEDEEPFKFETIGREKYSIEIGFKSSDFFNFFRFHKIFLNSYLRSQRNLSEYFGDKKEYKDARANTKNLITIKVRNLACPSVDEAIAKSSRAIEACFFQLSYLKALPLWLVEEWPSVRRNRVVRRFMVDEPYEGWNFDIKASYNSDLIRIYQYAMSTNIAEMRFLSFYQVMEYFFVQTANERLYEKLSNKLKDPMFTLSDSNLDKLVQDVVKHRIENDETEMLKNVLGKFVEEQELISFIKLYETFLGKQVYSKKHDVFGSSMEVRLEQGQVISNIAKHIKETRNAIVHSSDRFERNTRHIPFTESTGQIEIDIPVMKFLAEKVIINSAIPL